MTKYFTCLNKYKVPFDIDGFFEFLNVQINLNKEGENIIQMYHSGSFNNLIFPLYRASKRKRVSEQEARFLFAYEIMKNGDFDFAFLGAWNFADEIKKKEVGKKFITHVPTVRVI